MTILQTFTPILNEMYPSIVSRNCSIVFVSLDQEEAAFEQYRKTMSWPAIPFQDARRALLQIGLQVKSIPTLVFIDRSGRVLTASGVAELMNDRFLEHFPYESTTVDLSEGTNVEKLQRSASLVAFCEGCSSEVQLIVAEALRGVGAANAAPLVIPRSPRKDLLFASMNSPGKLCDALRLLCALPPSDKNTLRLVLVDLSGEQFFSEPIEVGGEEDPSSLRNLITKTASDMVHEYQSYRLEMKPMVKLPTSGEDVQDIEVPSPSDE